MCKYLVNIYMINLLQNWAFCGVMCKMKYTLQNWAFSAVKLKVIYVQFFSVHNILRYLFARIQYN